MLLYPVLAGVCLPIGFERYRFLPILFLLPFFWHGMRRLPLKQRMLAYWLMATVTNIGGYHWIHLVAKDYGGMPTLLSWGLVLLFSMFNNLNFVLWAYLQRFFGDKSNPFVIAALFCVAEQLNPQVFPWYFGTCLDSALILYQTADLWGVIGLSFVAITVIHIPWWIWRHRKTILGEGKLLLVGQLAFLIFISAYGAWALNRYNNDPASDKKSVGISAIQSNTSMEKSYGARLNEEERLKEFGSIVKISERAISEHESKTELLVWPEGAVHFPILTTPQVLEEISNLVKTGNVYSTAGSIEDEGRNSNGRWIYYNTQFIFNPEGEVEGRYHKIILLAFGEYIPFLETFPILEKWLPQNIAKFTRGTEKPVFSIRADLHWLPLICYEDIIPGFISGFEHEKADFMVNTTNDGWFGKSDASHLHKQMARPRTVEYRKPIVRALNTGSSQVIDAAGRIISKQTDLYTQDFINITLNLPQEPPVTVYARIGNLPIYVLIGLVAVLWFRGKFLAK